MSPAQIKMLTWREGRNEVCVYEGAGWVVSVHLTTKYLLSSYYGPGNSVKHRGYFDKQKTTPIPQEKKKRDYSEETSTPSFTWNALIAPFWTR